MATKFYASIDEYILILETKLSSKVQLMGKNADYNNATFYCKNMEIVGIINKFTKEKYDNIKLFSFNYKIGQFFDHILCYKSFERAFNSEYHVFFRVKYTGKVKYYRENGVFLFENNFKNGKLIKSND